MKNEKPITLYGMNWSGPVMKVRLLLLDLAIPFEFKEVNLAKGEQHSESYKRLNPVSRVPTIICHDRDFTLNESNTILRYLVDRYDAEHLYPKNLEDRAMVDRWVEYFSHHVNPYVGKLLWNRVYAPMFKFPVNQYDIDDSVTRLSRTLADLESYLSINGSILCRSNPFSLADITALPWLGCAKTAQIDLTSYPAIRSWLSQIEKRPSWQQVLSTLKS